MTFSTTKIDAFQAECKRLGLPTYLRTPRGDDIDAACGQLANRSKGGALVPLRKNFGATSLEDFARSIARSNATSRSNAATKRGDQTPTVASAATMPAQVPLHYTRRDQNEGTRRFGAT